MSKRRCIETKFDSILPISSTFGSPSAKLVEAIKNEYKCLEEATTKKNVEPLYFMLDNDPICPYRMKPLDVRPSCHAGQLKLFLSEFWFLSKYSSYANTIIYVGSADGQHISLLAELFPKLHFYLYDPRPFHKSLNGIVNITIKNQFFDITDAQFYHGIQNLLFISDIRSGDPKDKEKDFSLAVRTDMQNQMNWVQIIKPYCSMLKFCLPYSNGSTLYLAGQLRYGIFATQSGTEMRLIVRDTNEMKLYDHKLIEERCYYFNNFTRIVRYDFYNLKLKYPWHKIGIDFCWDCCAFLRILKDHANEKDIFLFASDIIDACGAKKKLLLSPHGDIYTQWISSRINYNGFKMFSKGKTDAKSPQLIDFIYKVYNENASIAPPLGEYCGSLFS